MRNNEEREIDGQEHEANPLEQARNVIGMITRRRWIVGICMVVILLGAIAVLLKLPNKYTSEATIFAVQQRIPERYVVPTSNTDASQALEALVQEVLSRPRLLGVIEELGLYTEQEGLRPDELIELIRRDLKVEPLDRLLSKGEVYAFRVSFVSTSPELAYRVTQKLTDLFIQQNVETRTNQAETTSGFLQEQIETTKQELLARERRLRDYKMQYLGQLPEQQQGNLGILASLQAQLNSVMTSRGQAQQQKLILESLLSEYEARSRRPAAVRSSTGETVSPAQLAERELARLQAERHNLLTTYTANHPDVKRKEEEIALQRGLVDSLRSASKSSEKQTGSVTETAEDPEFSVLIAQMRGQLRANSLELDNLDTKEGQIRVDIEKYQGRINMAPVREQQIASMQRDYELLKNHYSDLLTKGQESQLATDLEKRQEGQQFRLADPPNLPTVPTSPQRLKMSFIGLGGGLALGCALAFLLEMKSPAYHRENELKKLDLPMVVGVPLILTPQEERRRTWFRVLEWGGGLVLCTVVAAAEYYVYLNG
jgi:polysaccharide chain length determinant protein (PEP-CTERM system associated)